MAISNERDGGQPGRGFLADLLRLQAEFQTRMTDETLRYMRELQARLGPSAPGTVVRADSEIELAASGVAGGDAALEVEIHNRQRAHCFVTPALSPLVSGEGTTWFPNGTPDPPSLILPPDESARLRVALDLPQELPAGTYRGALILQGFRDDAIPVAVEVAPQRPDGPDRAPSRRGAGPRSASATDSPQQEESQDG